MSFTLPFGFNRADGTTSLPSQTNGLVSGKAGKATPSTSIDFSGDAATVANAVEEYADSPEIERAEQGTAQHRFTMLWQSALNYIQVLGRGTFITDGFGNRWRILSSKIQALRGGMASLSVTSESLSFDSPPDEFQCVPVELGVDIMKHPRYNWALIPWANDQSAYITYPFTAPGKPIASGYITINFNDIKQSIIRMIQTYRDTPYFASGDNINGYVQTNILHCLKKNDKNLFYVTTSFHNPNFDPGAKEITPSGTNNLWDRTSGTALPGINCRTFCTNVNVDATDASHPVNIALAAAYEILSKLWRGEDTPPVTGYEITWSQYYFAPTYLNPGNFVENPIGIIPAYFTDPTQTGTHTIFDYLTYWNPQSFAQNGQLGGILDLSCLRKPDEVDYQRTWFKVTRKWLCSPVGHWDTDLNRGGTGKDSTSNRPQIASDFNQVI
jgi:hypothetical protein